MTSLKKRKNQNARKHGVYAAEILPNSNADGKFKKTRGKLVKHLRPSGPLQHAIVRDLAARMLQKRQFDRWYGYELGKALASIDAGGMQSKLQIYEDLGREIAELEQVINKASISMGTFAMGNSGKAFQKNYNEIAEIDKVRKAVLVPLLESRERMRKEIEESPLIRTLERLKKCDAAMASGLERSMKQLAMAKTFDELYGSKLIEHRPQPEPRRIEDRADATTARRAPGIDNVATISGQKAQLDTDAPRSEPGTMMIYSSADSDSAK